MSQAEHKKIVTVGSGGRRNDVQEPPRGRFNPLVVETLNGVTTSTGDMSAAKAAFWSKPSCRRCHGRGLETISWPNGRERITACSCVLKNMATR
jgi:hypothetical protein